MAIVILGVGCYTLDFSWHDFFNGLMLMLESAMKEGFKGSGPFPGVIW